MGSLKNNRKLSFIIIGIVYVIATLVGISVYQSLNLSWWLSLLLADVAATVVTFAFSLFFGNASVYDPYWSVQPIVIFVGFSLSEGLNTLGILLLAALLLWGIRLTANWAYTFKNLNHQDWRYTMLKEKTGVFYPVVNFCGIHMVPTLIVYFCTLPAVYAVKNNLTVNIGSIIFICVSFFAALMQGVADIQMHKFRKHRNAPFIQNGLWKYSRHPNYLGEILMWWGIALCVVCAQATAWNLLLGALANTVLFLVVSIPMADKRQSRKKDFAEYKSQTRMLLPIKRF